MVYGESMDSHPEFVYQWGIFAHRPEIEKLAEELGVTLCYGEAIQPGDLYLAMRNTGPKLLTCRELGKACVFPTNWDYPYDFSECVKVRESA